MTARRPVVDSERGRKADLAAIHVAKKLLGWSEDEYRDIMATVCGGVRSAGDLDFAGRKRFLAHLQACQLANGQKPAGKPAKPPMPPHLGKMWSLWMQLADAGQVKARSMSALAAWTKRQLQVDHPRFLNGPQQDLAIERLKQWLKSRGVEPT